jgi:hypothetical protein
MDIDLQASDVPMSGSFVRVWGIGVDQINQAQNLHGKPIKVFGGMAKGLPLAKPEQAGLLTQGYVFKSDRLWSVSNRASQHAEEPA